MIRSLTTFEMRKSYAMEAGSPDAPHVFRRAPITSEQNFEREPLRLLTFQSNRGHDTFFGLNEAFVIIFHVDQAFKGFIALCFPVTGEQPPVVSCSAFRMRSDHLNMNFPYLGESGQPWTRMSAITKKSACIASATRHAS